MKYKLNQFVVFNGHGVCKVKRIENRELAGNKKQYLILVNTYMTFVVPVDSSSIRPLVSKKDAKAFLDLAPDTIKNQGWNKRYRYYLESLKTGSLKEAISVYRCLNQAQTMRDLSYGERKMKEYAFELAASELRLVLKLNSNDVADLLNNTLKEAV